MKFDAYIRRHFSYTVLGLLIMRMTFIMEPKGGHDGTIKEFRVMDNRDFILLTYNRLAIDSG